LPLEIRTETKETDGHSVDHRRYGHRMTADEVRANIGTTPKVAPRHSWRKFNNNRWRQQPDVSLLVALVSVFILYLWRRLRRVDYAFGG
jgi:hypothetical protein